MAEKPCAPAQNNPEVQERTKALFDAVLAGDITRVKEIVEAFPEMANAVNETGAAPLQYAILALQRDMKKHEAIALYLIGKGANPNRTQACHEGEGAPMLALAISQGLEEVAVALLDHGADMHWKQGPCVIDEREMSPGGVNLLMWTAGWNAARVAGVLLDRGADVNETDANGLTPLMHAAKCGRPEMAELFISRGANLGLQDKDGHDVIYYAEAGMRKAALPVLREAFQKAATEAETIMKSGTPARITIATRKLQFRKNAKLCIM
jgi:ankyrin repeat protein